VNPGNSNGKINRWTLLPRSTSSTSLGAKRRASCGSRSPVCWRAFRPHLRRASRHSGRVTRHHYVLARSFSLSANAPNVLAESSRIAFSSFSCATSASKAPQSGAISGRSSPRTAVGALGGSEWPVCVWPGITSPATDSHPSGTVLVAKALREDPTDWRGGSVAGRGERLWVYCVFRFPQQEIGA
jgi:hypothetical protein